MMMMQSSVHSEAAVPDTQTPPATTVPIVALGASAGGLEPLETFLKHCPGDIGCAVVVLQHLPSHGDSELPDIMARNTDLPVLAIADNQVIETGHIYVLKPGHSLAVEGGRFKISALPDQVGAATGVIDGFMSAMADHSGELAIGVVLSGTGTDGTEGIKAIRELGGMTLAQDPHNAQFTGMPDAAIHTGIVDYVGLPENMPQQIMAYVRNTARQEDSTPPHDQALDEIIALLSRNHSNDFHHYKKKTIVRRLQRRMSLSHCPDLSAYLELLRESPDEVVALYQDLLISVTGFFRDPLALQTLDKRVFSQLIDESSAEDALRIWVPGCATGEEAYTLAILCHERMRQSGRQRPLLIFATDIDEQALAIARQGLYPDSIKNRLAPELISRYFTPEGSYYRVGKTLREEIVFASQNLITSAPFSQLDLISCRNLLIYLKVEIQAEIMGLFHFALKDGGYLFLGSAESVGRQESLFAPVDQPARLFRRKNTHQKVTPNLPFTAGAAAPIVSKPKTSRHLPTQTQLGERVHHHLLTQYTPPAALVSRDGEIFYFAGDTSDFLRQPSGQPSHNLFDVARSDIKSKLRGAFRKIIDDGETQRLAPGHRSDKGQASDPVIVITPLAFNQVTLYLITFEQHTDGEIPAAVQPREAAESDLHETPALIQQLEEELSTTRAELLSTIEDLETSNQDLKVANEEAVSMNEEMQSTNEELETSKEELQSLNEEISTVNTELKSKVEELDHAYNDLDNLLRSISSATLFVDLNGIVQLFTANCRDIFHLVDTDIGRPLDEIKFKIEDATLFEDIHKTGDTLQTLEQDIGSDESAWFLRRTAPYRTAENKIDGVVVTYTNVTRLREAQRELKDFANTLEQRVTEATRDREAQIVAREEATRERDNFFELSAAPLFIMTESFGFTLLNSAWERIFGWPLDQLYTMSLEELIHPEDWFAFKRAIDALSRQEERQGLKARLRSHDGFYAWFEWDIRCDPNGSFVGSGRDVSGSVQSAKALTVAQDELEKQVHSRARHNVIDNELAQVTLMCIGEAVITTNVSGTVTTINPVAERLLGYSTDWAVGRPIDEVLVLLNESSQLPLHNPVSRVIKRKRTVAIAEAALLVQKNGSKVPVEASIAPIFDNRDLLIGTVVVLFDVSYSRKLTQDISYRANHDDLTGLVNRGEFENRFKTTVESAQNSGRTHCLLYLDLDQFKFINDTCGHSAGDELLRQLAVELQTHVRQRDTLARLGGDEFALILENCLPDEAGRIAEDILQFIRDFRFDWEGKSFQVGISIGITDISGHSGTPGELLKNADDACYMAKEAGRNRAHFFNAERLDEQAQRSVMHWAGRVTQALETDRLQLVAQPIISLKDGAARGTHFEFLARLNDTEGELVTPAYFLPAAERYNLMPSFDQHVVEKAFAWLAENPETVENLTICSINLSAATLGDDRFPALLETLIQEYSLPPQKICFEITETLAITNLSRTIALAEEFKRQGFMFALDDFGSGFSSYHYLKRLPVDFLKIDGEFVKGILDDPVDEAMVRSMNEIGHIMGKKTIAEFVESQGILEKLREIGVDYVQGYLTGKPDSLPSTGAEHAHQTKGD